MSSPAQLERTGADPACRVRHGRPETRADNKACRPTGTASRPVRLRTCGPCASRRLPALRAGGYYRPGSYLLAKMVLDALLLRVIPVFVFSAAFYPMVRPTLVEQMQPGNAASHARLLHLQHGKPASQSRAAVRCKLRDAGCALVHRLLPCLPWLPW